MVVTLLANAGHVLKDELTYEMLYIMFDKINDDLKGVLKHEKDELAKLFKVCEKNAISPVKALLKHAARITSYTNTAMFCARQAVI
ncbi:MAG: hypothetical protein WBF77_11945 [Sulfurimonadaceae bacterium]